MSVDYGRTHAGVGGGVANTERPEACDFIFCTLTTLKSRLKSAIHSDLRFKV